MKLMFEDDGAQLVEMFRRAQDTGVTTSLDMALPDPASAAGRASWVTILKSTLPYVDIFLPSIEEILYMLHRETYDELCRAASGPSFLPLITPQLLSDLSRELLEMGVKIVVLKLGERGLYVRTADRSAIESLRRARPSAPAAWAEKELSWMFVIHGVLALRQMWSAPPGQATRRSPDFSPRCCAICPPKRR